MGGPKACESQPAPPAEGLCRVEIEQDEGQGIRMDMLQLGEEVG